MAKKNTEESNGPERITRREVLLKRKRERENRQVRLVVGSIAGVILVVLAIGVVIEFIVRPSQPVAEVNGEEIALQEFQDRVTYERAQVVLQIEDLTEAVGGDIGQVQQFAQNQLSLLLQPEILGQQVLDRMIEEVLIRQEAERRGIVITEEDVDEAIGEQFGYLGGESPTPVPTGTPTVEPTPSITPLATPTVEGAPTITPTATLVGSPTPGPTSTPRPTATPVSEEVFQERFNDQLDRLSQYGIGEALYRDIVEAQLYRERVRDALAAEAELPEEGEHASFYIIFYQSQEEAEQALGEIQAIDYLSVWNSVRSAPPPVDGAANAPFATEVLFRTRDDLSANLDAAILDFVFEGPIGEPSEVFETIGQDGSTQYVIVQTSGREIRPFTQARLNQDAEEFVDQWLAEQSVTGVTRNELWRDRVPGSPRVPDEYYQPQPTAAAPVLPSQ